MAPKKIPKVAPKKKPGRPPGRGPFTPTKAHRKLVTELAGMVIPDSDICRLILYDGEAIGENTLKNHFRKELSTGRAQIRVRHGMALMKAIEDGNVTAMIWWDKTRNGIRERLGIDVPATAGGEQEKTSANTLDIARRIAYTLSMGADQSGPAKKKEPA